MFKESYGGVLLERPIIADDARIRQFSDDLIKIFRMLTSLPDRLFDGDLARYCAAVGIDSRLADIMARDATGDPPLFGRCDAYDDGQDFKLLEFNVGTELGGMDFAEMSRSLCGVPAIREFVEQHNLSYVDTADLVADQLKKVAEPVATSDHPVVVLLETTGGIAAHPNYRSVQEAMIHRGVDFRLGEVQEVSERAGRLMLDGTAIDVAMRFYAAGEIVSCPYGPQVLDPVYRARDAGGTVLFTGLESSLYGAKGGLAILSNARSWGGFDSDELAVIDRVLPWTRSLTGDPDLAALCRAERHELIIKPSVGWGATGTVLGRDLTDEQWRGVLAGRAADGYVVQRVVTPCAEPVVDPDTGEVEDWWANWGLFVTPAGYAGAFVRALQPSDGTIITFGNKGTRGSAVFTSMDAT